VKLHFLGTTGYHPNNQRQTACLMLPEMGIVLDAGTGMFRVRDLIETDTLDIFLSHIHLDHCIGLTFLYDVLFEKNMKRVTVHVAEEKIDSLRQHLYAESLFPVGPNFELRPLKMGGPTTLSRGPAPATMTAIPVSHPGGCNAFRIDWTDRRLAYVTDTTAHPAADYVRHLQGIDTLVHECYFPDGCEDKAKLTGHSCLTSVAQVAHATKAGRCFLVHIDPLNESAEPLELATVADVYDALEIAHDHQVIDV
jgi:ribonuclease BN (tRNA processing enzyme)